MAEITLYNNTCISSPSGNQAIYSYEYTIKVTPVNANPDIPTEQPEGDTITDTRLIGKTIQTVEVYGQAYTKDFWVKSHGHVTMNADTGITWSEPATVIVYYKITS